MEIGCTGVIHPPFQRGSEGDLMYSMKYEYSVEHY